MFIGTFGALKQVRIKRFIAFTSISQVGFIILGISSLSIGGLVATILYLCIYALMSLVFFTILLNTEHIVTKKNISYLSQLYCLSVTSKAASCHLYIVLFSMAGVPPLGGFIGKLFIYISAIDSGLDIAVIFSLLLSIVSTYYYLNFIHYMGFVKYNVRRLFFVKLTESLHFLLVCISLILIYVVFLLPYILPSVTFLAFSCIWPFIFF